MDYKKFFDKIRGKVKIKDTKAVQGFEHLIAEGIRRGAPVTFTAYVLATAYHETAHTMQPITEFGSRSYFNKYEPTTAIGRALGNKAVGDGFKYRGRGFVQITGKHNYEKFGIADNPDLALDLDKATEIIWDGMTDGTFTGKKMADYLDDPDPDWRNARRIVNGVDKADLIGGYGKLFVEALLDSGYGQKATQKPVQRVPGKGNKGLAAAIILALLGAAIAILKQVLGL